MKMVKICGMLPLIILLLGFSTTFAVELDEYSVLTENFPPFNFEQDGKLQGFSTDILELMLKTAGSRLTRADFAVLPWSRAYQATLEREKTLLYSTTRTPKRERLFKWVGPIAPNRNVLMARKDRKITIHSLADIKNFKVGVVSDDAGEQLLVSAGVEKSRLDSTSDAKSNILKLHSGRVDLFAYPEAVTLWDIKSYGMNPEEFESVYVLDEGEVYFALNVKTPDSVVKTLQDALDTLKKSGQIAEIMKHYK